MKVLVTGGAGYIGSTTSHELIAAGHSVVVFDDLSQGHEAAVPPEAAFVKGDLANKILIDETMAIHKPEAVMHFASNTLVGESVEMPFLYIGDNVTNGLNLIRSAVANGVSRFILSSTANLFDDPEEIPISEATRIVPGSPYGESKYILERLLHWTDEIYGLRYAALRYFNACGAASPTLGEDHDPETHLIPLVLQVALGQREHVVVFGNDYSTTDGTCVRDYIHVLDLARAHILALEDLDRGSRTYNLGNGRGYSVQEVIETARQVTGHAIPSQIGSRRPGDPDTLIASSEKIKQELGWNPQHTDLTEIVEGAWRWHKANPHGYGK